MHYNQGSSVISTENNEQKKFSRNEEARQIYKQLSSDKKMIVLRAAEKLSAGSGKKERSI